VLFKENCPLFPADGGFIRRMSMGKILQRRQIVEYGKDGKRLECRTFLCYIVTFRKKEKVNAIISLNRFEG